MKRINVVNAKDGVVDEDSTEKVAVMVDSSVALVELMWPLQDRLKLRDSKDDLAACSVNARGKVTFLNSNFSLDGQGFSPEGLVFRFFLLLRLFSSFQKNKTPHQTRLLSFRSSSWARFCSQRFASEISSFVLLL
jgi:hypothetical protein